MKKFLKRFIVFKLLSLIVRQKLNVWYTIKINHRLFDRKTAKQFPILVFGKLKLELKNAKGVIDAPIKFGMINVGVNFDNFFSDHGGGVIAIHNGELTFKGACTISSKVSLIIYGGKLEIGDCSVIGCGTHIQSRKSVVIGQGCRISQFIIILDTNIHYMRNVETGIVLQRESSVAIGNYCWVGMRSRIMKGSILPDYSIVAAGTLINKDMSNSPLYPTLAGTPAKVVGSGKVRVFDIAHESKLNIFFANNPGESYCQDVIGLLGEMEANAIQFNYDKTLLSR